MQFIDLDPSVRVNLRKAAAHSLILDALENPHHSFDHSKQKVLADAVRIEDARFISKVFTNEHYDYDVAQHFFGLKDEIVNERRMIAQRRRANANFTARATKKVFA